MKLFWVTFSLLILITLVGAIGIEIALNYKNPLIAWGLLGPTLAGLVGVGGISLKLKSRQRKSKYIGIK